MFGCVAAALTIIECDGEKNVGRIDTVRPKARYQRRYCCPTLGQFYGKEFLLDIVLGQPRKCLGYFCVSEKLF